MASPETVILQKPKVARTGLLPAPRPSPTPRREKSEWISASRRHLAFAAGLGALLWFVASGCHKQTSGEDEFTRLSNVGKNYLEKGDGEHAVATFERAAAMAPASPDAQLNLANAYLVANQAEKALPHAAEALRLDPSSAAAHYLAGCAYLRLDKAELALQSLQQSQKIDPAVTAVNFQIAVAHERLGQFEEAITQLEAAVQFEPDHPAAHYRLHQLLLRQGRKTEAEEELKKHEEIRSRKLNLSTDPATFEKCKYTQARLPFKLQPPDPQGIPIAFMNVSAAALPGAGVSYRGPIGVLDFNHDGNNGLIVATNDGFQFLVNSNGSFHPVGPRWPGLPGAHYSECLIGDLQNDHFEDVIILGDHGSHVFKLATNAGVTEVSRFAGLQSVTSVAGTLIDYDYSGKLSLLTLAPNEGGPSLLRNLGNLYFTGKNTTSGLPAQITGARQIVAHDWNNDDLLDLLIARAGQPPLLFLRQRGGSFAATNPPANWPSGSVIAVGDLDNDQRADLVIAGEKQIAIAFGDGTNLTALAIAGFKVNQLILADLDNDGWLDIVASGNPGLRVWRNLGPAGFRDVTTAWGLDRAAAGNIEAIALADFDGDCDTDLLVAIEGKGLQLLRNDGGNANHQLKLRLIGTRSNASGLGTQLELRAGNWRTWRTVDRLPVEIGVGSHKQVDSLSLRWFDTSISTEEIPLEPCSVLEQMELILPTGSCPYLYAWDGSRYRFVTDLLGAAPLGLPVAEGKLIAADPQEYVWIGNDEIFQPQSGSYRVQITEELREVLYLDEAKLVAVDHPIDTEAHTTGKLVPSPPFPEHKIVTLGQRYPLRQAINHEGTDVTSLVAETDGQMLSPTQLRAPQLRGLAETHAVTMDFGPLPERAPLVLALTGWLRFGGGMANISASYEPDLPFPFPVLEAETAPGAWTKIDVTVGAPAGKTKTILVDLKGKLPAGTRRLRITEGFEIHWDRLALFARMENPSATSLLTLAPSQTDLHWRGFSEFEPLSWQHPLTPSYERVQSQPPWRITPSGWCTRYGAVDTLVARQDDALVLLNGGDELTLSFRANQLPPKPAGMRRDFFLYSVGWDKDADFHCVAGEKVEPLPWNGMDSQRYGTEPLAGSTNTAWMQKYNTRWVGPRTIARSQPHPPRR